MHSFIPVTDELGGQSTAESADEVNMKDYLVKINWRGELLEFYTTAATDKLALINACHQLAAKVMWRPLAVFTEVYNKQNSYSVTIRPKKEQV